MHESSLYGTGRSLDWPRPYVLGQKKVHELSPSHIHEEIELRLLDFSFYIIEWTIRPYRWRDHYLSHGQTSSYFRLTAGVGAYGSRLQGAGRGGVNF